MEGKKESEVYSEILFLIVVRRVNELKSEIDISDDIVMKFQQFWAHFKDSPLKGCILIRTSCIACISQIHNLLFSANIGDFMLSIKSWTTQCSIIHHNL